MSYLRQPERIFYIGRYAITGKLINQNKIILSKEVKERISKDKSRE
jgi:hypothetical protein